jgi:hypothetical protein
VIIIGAKPKLTAQSRRRSSSNDGLALRVDGVKLKDVFRQIETNPRNGRQFYYRLAHGQLHFRWVDDKPSWRTMPLGASSTPSPAVPPPSLPGRVSQCRSETAAKRRRTLPVPQRFRTAYVSVRRKNTGKRIEATSKKWQPRRIKMPKSGPTVWAESTAAPRD